MAVDVLYIGAGMRETLTGLSDAVTGTYLNAATVTWTLYDASGTAVTGGTGTYSYTAASNGNYTTTIPSTVTALLTDGQKYYLDVVIVQSSYNDERRLWRRAAYRGGS